jgi:DNA (cytosine-5)-methyltransferase 1
MQTTKDLVIDIFDPLFIAVDLFCGAGGTTTGFDTAVLSRRVLSEYGVGKDFMENGFSKIVKVIACVNHDPIAIKSHWRNHPEVKHFEEDIRTLDLTELKKQVAFYRNKYPNALLILWASLECTNFSKAKGGQPRDADSRTLADHLERYVVALNPDLIQIENVVEFMSWGPLDENGTPISKRNGEDYMRWREMIKVHGYRDDWRELNSANFGAYTSRNRLFGIFAKPGIPIVWPEATHEKVREKQKGAVDLFSSSQQPWKAVKEVLDFEDEGQSIFNRKKPLSDKTLERILAGLIKYVAKGDKAFISKYFSGKPKGKVNSVQAPASTVTTFGNQSLVQTKSFSDLSVDQPAGALTTIDHHALVQTAAFIQQRHGGKPESKIVDVNGPARTITSTGGNQDLVQATFLTIYNGKSLCRSTDQPAPVIACNDRLSLIQPFLMPTNFDNPPKSIEDPAPVITANRKHTYLVNPSHGGWNTSTEQPCPVIIARQDKAPLYLVQAKEGPFMVPIYPDDSEVMIEIKKFMAMFNIVDIKMRMLRVLELLKIQGFPADYKLEGNQADQKKFIGNSVVPLVVKAWLEALGTEVLPILYQKKVA